ncbi:FAD-binding oxidoreductase [Streptomyces albipurpureus]|uniref:FAD-binding oxidoreductase n=1 Tax=Streptomyces albipurpureus TaxID=2897419 RepID=A0ABT0UF38_9ACTN|nr:FAD-binding oxidoreductase [Streptomyces sp. CWNU-1]MCM2387217.1 FAD-binding oxidoreductase [Streptomyces sp. CWNU-1]
MSALADGLGGRLVLPSDPGYTSAVQLQNTEYDSTAPQAVAYCATSEDIAACLRHARDGGLRVHVRGGGHSFNGWSTGEGLVIDLSRMNRVALRVPGDRTGTGGPVGTPTVLLGAGTRSVDALDALRPLSRQIATGTFPTVSAGGFLTGGGIGWQTRRFGIASDRLVSAQVVLADGRAAHCSATEEPDLFWALRGGGGATFGIVTACELRPIDAPVMTGFETLWAYDDAVPVLAAWQDWCAEGPDELGTSLVVLPGMFGPHGRPVVKVWGVHLGPTGQLHSMLDELAERAGAKPVSRAVGPRGGYADVMHQALCGAKTVAQCHRTGTGPGAEGHRHPYTRQAYRLTGRPAGRASAAALLAAWEADPVPERYLLCIAVGGAANRFGRTETAYVHRDAQFLMGYQIACREPGPDPETAASMTAWADRCAAALKPLACGSYINFPSSRITDGWEEDYFGENLPRLLEVKRAYDPDNVLHHAQSVGTHAAKARTTDTTTDTTAGTQTTVPQTTTETDS